MLRILSRGVSIVLRVELIRVSIGDRIVVLIGLSGIFRMVNCS